MVPSAPHPAEEWRVTIQRFADYISAAASRAVRKITSASPAGLARALLLVPAKLDLDAAAPKCRNFLADGARRDSDLEKEEKLNNLQRGKTERNMLRTSEDLDRVQTQRLGKCDTQLPYC